MSVLALTLIANLILKNGIELARKWPKWSTNVKKYAFLACKWKEMSI